VFLLWKSPRFAEQKPAERLRMLEAVDLKSKWGAGLSEARRKEVAAAQQKRSVRVRGSSAASATALQADMSPRTRARTAADAAAAREAAADGEGSNSIAVMGLRATVTAQRRLQMSQPLLTAAGIDSTTPTEIQEFVKMQMYAISEGNWRMNVYDGTGWRSLLGLIRPALLPHTMTYDTLR